MEVNFGYNDIMIEHLFFWSILTLCTTYCALQLYLIIGINRLTYSKYTGGPQGISVIIAANNEGQNIRGLLQSLALQKYPTNCFEVIVVNDRSSDNTEEIIRAFSDTHHNFHAITIRENTSDMPHKKNALRTAIARSRFDILAFTDADCSVPQHWLREISESFEETVGVVAGYSPYAKDPTSGYLRFEEFKITLLASAMIGMKNAFLCTGRNFAYRKQVYHEVNGFESIKHSVSGDDDLFLQAVQRTTRWEIRYMTSPESVVYTMPPDSLGQFIHQRTRHISASRYYPAKIKTYYALIHLFHVFVFVGFVFFPLISLICLLIKLNIDALFNENGKRLFNEEFSLLVFFFSEIMLVLYSFFIGPLGFIKKFTWKGVRT